MTAVLVILGALQARLGLRAIHSPGSTLDLGTTYHAIATNKHNHL